MAGTETTAFAGFRACKCLKDYYRTNLFAACKPCTLGLECQDDFANLKDGFWWKWENTTHRELYRNFIKTVKNSSFTPELHNANDSGIVYPYTIPQQYRCPMTEACKGGLNSSCDFGYEETLCAVCSDGYYKQLKKCKLCPTKGWMIRQLAIMGAIVILLVLIVVWRSKKKSKKDTGRSFLDKALGSIKVVISFYQVTFGIMEAFSYIKWPESLSVIGGYSEIVQVNIVQIAPLHCIIPSLKFDAFASLFAVMGLNFVAVMVALASFVFATWKSTRHILNEEEKIRKKEQIKTVVKTNLFFFLYLTYLNTCLKTAQVLPPTCHRICVDEDKDEGCEQYLKADYSINCKGERYNRLVIVGYCSTMYVIVLPVAAFITIWKQQRADTKTEDETTNETNVLEDQKTVQTALRFLRESYNSRCWYWEAVETFRKVILTSGLILIGSESRAYIGLALVSSGLYSMYFGLKKPISDPFENKLMLSSLAVTFVNLAIGAVSTIPDEVFSSSVGSIMDTLLFNSLVFVANSLLIGLLLGKSKIVFLSQSCSYLK